MSTLIQRDTLSLDYVIPVVRRRELGGDQSGVLVEDLQTSTIPADPATGQVARTVPAHIADGLLSAKDLGLTGSGNERTVLQALLTAGRSFSIPAGMVITISSGVTVATDYTRIHGPGSIACSAGTFNAITVTADHCEFVGLPLVGSGGESGLATGCSIFINGGNHNKIKDCIFTNHYRGAFIQEGQYNRIERNLFTDGIVDGSDISLQSSSAGGEVINNNIVTENYCLSTNGYGVALQVLDSGATVSECQYNIISKNRITSKGAYGIMLYDQDNDGNSVNLTSGNQIEGNVVTDITGSIQFPIELDRRYGAGIYVQSFEGTVVNGNTVERTNLQTDLEQLSPGGIGVANVGRIVITGNIIKDCAWFGIYLNDALDYGNTDGCLNISGNEVSGSGKSGIKATRIMRFKIDANTINDSAEFGILVTHATLDSNYGSINNNVIRHNTGDNSALQVSHGNAITINGNTVTGSTVHGITLFNSKQVTINSNVIMETTTDAISIGSTNSEGITISGNIIRRGSPTSGRGINLGSRAMCSGNHLAGFTNFANTTATSNTAWNGTYIPFQSAAPTTGTWIECDVVMHSSPAPSTTPGWVCTTGGTPGTWNAMAALAA